jgi:hypothetical protein
VSSVNAEEGARRLGVFGEALGDDETAASFAEAMLAAAVRNAAGYPSPQSRMSASGLELRGKAIEGRADALVSSSGRSVRLGDVIFGSEFGSSLFAQFGARDSRGNWLFRAADDPATIEQVERERIDKLIGEVAT